jgi:hypothetical protein
MTKVTPGYEKSVYKDLLRRRGVRNVYCLFGEFNFFLIMQAERKSMLNNLLNEIKEDGKVIKTGPVLLTVDSDMPEMAYAKAEAAFG